MEENKHYLLVDEAGRVLAGWSDGPFPDRDTSGAVLLREDGGYQFRLFPGGEENPPLTDETGALLQCAPRDAEAVLLQTYDLDALLESRSSWGLFRDRRPEYYGAITHRAQDDLTR